LLETPRESKKEEFPGIMFTCRRGTPFPRSALFLDTDCLNLSNGTRVLKGDDIK